MFSPSILQVPASQLSSSITSSDTNLVSVPLPIYISSYVFQIPQNTYWTQVGWIILVFVVLRSAAVLALQFISHVKR
jgi:hypothetical protein